MYFKLKVHVHMHWEKPLECTESSAKRSFVIGQSVIPMLSWANLIGQVCCQPSEGHFSWPIVGAVASRSSLVFSPLSVLACALFRIYLNEPEPINTATLDAINGLSISTHTRVKSRYDCETEWGRVWESAIVREGERDGGECCGRDRGMHWNMLQEIQTDKICKN